MYVYGCTPHRWTSWERVWKETAYRMFYPIVCAQWFNKFGTVDGTLPKLDAFKLLPVGTRVRPQTSPAEAPVVVFVVFREPRSASLDVGLGAAPPRARRAAEPPNIPKHQGAHTLGRGAAELPHHRGRQLGAQHRHRQSRLREGGRDRRVEELHQRHDGPLAQRVLREGDLGPGQDLRLPPGLQQHERVDVHDARGVRHRPGKI